MPPIAMSREYFAELLEIGKSNVPQSERLQQVELVVEQYLAELEAANVGDIEAEDHRARFIDLVSQALIDPSVPPSQPFVELPPEIDIVFDLGGAMGGDSAESIRSAVQQSDLVIVPVYNEYKSINGAYHTILEVREINPNILIVGTKLLKQRNEIFADWSDSRDFRNVRDTLRELTDKNYPALPLKFSKGFEVIFDQEKSLRQLVEGGGIDAYMYRLVAAQFDKIYEFIEQGNYGNS